MSKEFILGVKAYRLKAQEFILQITASYAHQQACKMECCVGTVEDELKMLLPNARGFPFWDNAALPLQLLHLHPHSETEFSQQCSVPSRYETIFVD